ncbi:MAG TPA: methylmalonyl-CoA epimerase [Candidatus Eisenbacteria bacterium]|nr:methylmalonyl-CoA epimerase [Candidatus Eisenbacteria bacterium]
MTEAALRTLGLAHIGIAVPSIDAAIPAWESLGYRVRDREAIASMGLEVAFLDSGGAEGATDGTLLELLEPTAADTPVGRFLESRRGGLHHLAFLVPDLEAALRQAEALGLELIDRTPREGSHGLRIGFLHPRSFHGVLVELCQRRNA